jgi:hypothetical protein
MTSSAAFAICGFWESRRKGDNNFESLTRLTANPRAHPVINQAHWPGDEKRTLVIIESENYLASLNAKPLDAPASVLVLLQCWQSTKSMSQTSRIACPIRKAARFKLTEPQVACSNPSLAAGRAEHKRHA